MNNTNENLADYSEFFDRLGKFLDSQSSNAINLPLDSKSSVTNDEEDMADYYDQSESPEIVESFLNYVGSLPVVDENAPSIYDEELTPKYTCDLSATERGELFSNLYPELSKNLTRLEEIFGGHLDWTEDYILEFFNVFNEEMLMDTAFMSINLLTTIEKVHPIVQRLNTLNEVESADYTEMSNLLKDLQNHFLENSTETQDLLETSDDISVGINDCMPYQERQEFVKTRKYREEK